MKIRIAEPGWGSYTGHFGTVEFANGVSVDDVGRGDAAALAGLIMIVDDATGKNPSDAQRIVDDTGVSVTLSTLSSGDDAAKAAIEMPVAPALTKKGLETIADASGIKGLREISDPLGLKANSIAELIAKILEAQEEASKA